MSLPRTRGGRSDVNVGITCYPTVGGSGVVATELGIELARRGHTVHFISYALPTRLTLLHERLRFHEVATTAYPLFGDYRPYTLALASKMVEVAQHEKLDVLHVHYAIPHAISAFLAKQILSGSGLKVITTLHGTDITIVGRDPSYLPITKYGIEVSDGVTAVSSALRDDTIEHFQTTKPIEVIPNFIDPARFYRRDGKGPFFSCGRKVVCHMSNFRKVKRIEDVLQIFLRVQKRISARLVMIGDGPERPMAEAFVRDHNLEESVYFIGHVANVEDALGAIDLFLLPSETESFGMAALEALASEVPVIASRAGGLPEVVVDGEMGYLRPVGDVDAMAECAVEILSNDELWHRMGVAGRAWAIEQFDTAKIIPRYTEFYEKVLRFATSA